MNKKLHELLILLMAICLVCIGLFYFKLKNKVDTLETNITSMQENINELNEELEAYRDNYVALWTTINNGGN